MDKHILIFFLNYYHPVLINTILSIYKGKKKVSAIMSSAPTDFGIRRFLNVSYHNYKILVAVFLYSMTAVHFCQLLINLNEFHISVLRGLIFFLEVPVEMLRVNWFALHSAL